MKIMITGNQGYIGPVVTYHIRRQYPNVQVIGLDAGYFETDTVSSIDNSIYSPHVQIIKDVRDIEIDDFKDVDAVIHLAAISNDPMGKAFEDVTYAINHKATITTAQSAKAAGVNQFVFASSCSVYGKAGNQLCHEGADLYPLTAYAISKAKAEEDLVRLADPSFQVTAFRFATACGASPRIRLDLVLNDFVATALTSRQINILSDGTPWRPLIDVQDMAMALTWAIFNRSPTDSFLVLNAGRTDWNFQIRQLADTVSKICRNVPVTVNQAAPPDNRSYSVDFSKFERLGVLLGLNRSLETTTQEIIDVLSDVKELTSDFRNSRFIRLKSLNRLRQAGSLNELVRWTREATA